MVRCPYCGYEANEQSFEILREPWKFRFYTVKMLKCSKCHGVFNYYYGVSPRTGKLSKFVIKIKNLRGENKITGDANELSHVQDGIIKILERYCEYERLIRYPGDWGERAFRFWIIKELFIDILRWPSKNIVFGERYDVLLLDEWIRPRIYIETKRPSKQITNRDLEEAIGRAKDFFSIDYVVITNGITWILYDCIKNVGFRIDDVEKADSGRVTRFFSKIRARNFIGLE